MQWSKANLDVSNAKATLNASSIHWDSIHIRSARKKTSRCFDLRHWYRCKLQCSWQRMQFAKYITSIMVLLEISNNTSIHWGLWKMFASIAMEYMADSSDRILASFQIHCNRNIHKNAMHLNSSDMTRNEDAIVIYSRIRYSSKCVCMRNSIAFQV